MKNYFLDIETYEETPKGYVPVLNAQKFYLGLIMDEQGNEIYFRDSEKMYQHIMELLEGKEAVSLWGHYHTYDWYCYMGQHIIEHMKKKDIFIVRPAPLLAIYKYNNYFVDTMALASSSLEAFGEAIGHKKLEMPPIIQSHIELIPYLQRDVLLTKEIYDLFKEVLLELNYKPRKLLTASSAGAGLFMKFVGEQDKAGYMLNRGNYHKNKETLAFLRQASKGGRTEVFSTGKYKNTSYIDINSSYWKSMQDMVTPDILKERHITPDTIKDYPKEAILCKEGVAKATVIIAKQHHVGLLGIRLKTETGYSLIFPKKKGTIMEGYWTTAELNFAIQHGYIVEELHEAVIYEKNFTFNYLKEHITNLWKYRASKLEADTPREKYKAKIAKRLGNGLYGKFIQNSAEKDYIWIERKEIKKYLAEGWNIESSDGDYCLSKIREPYVSRYVCMILGILIASHGRIRITEQLLKIPNSKLLYCDTDGIVLTNPIPTTVPLGKDIGEYKIEASGDANILNEKVYYVDDKISIAGLPKKHHSKEIIDNPTPIQLDSIIGFKQAIKQNNLSLIGAPTIITKNYFGKSTYELFTYLTEVERHEHGKKKNTSESYS